MENDGMIDILRYEKTNIGDIIGYMDIAYDIDSRRFIIRKIPHIQNGNKRWCNLPSFIRYNEEGKAEYLKYFECKELFGSSFFETLNEKAKEHGRGKDETAH